ncbi:MAG: carbon-nitrogen hydrolase family protein [Nitrososphaeria archaeon]
MPRVRFGIIQMGRVEHLEEGLRTIEDLASTLGKVDLASLPEAWIERALDVDEERRLTEEGTSISSSLGGTLIMGGYWAVRNGRPLMVSRAISASGVLSEASKRFPSNAVGERLDVAQGDGPAVFDFPGGRAGTVICVDAMYPELVRAPALEGAQVVVNPASIPFDRIYLWRALAQSRAAENTVFFALVNLADAKYRDGRSVEGNSLIASPEGRIIVELGRKETTEVVNLELDEIYARRTRWPYLDDIREFYRGRRP